MPIYEYECKQCGSRFEKMQPVTAAPLTECVNCGQGPIKRLFHPVGVIFKGSGWYITDSRKSGGAGAAGGKESSTSESSGKSNDSKPSGDGGASEPAAAKATTSDAASAD